MLVARQPWPRRRPPAEPRPMPRRLPLAPRRPAVRRGGARVGRGRGRAAARAAACGLRRADRRPRRAHPRHGAVRATRLHAGRRDHRAAHARAPRAGHDGAARRRCGPLRVLLHHPAQVPWRACRPEQPRHVRRGLAGVLSRTSTATAACTPPAPAAHGSCPTRAPRGACGRCTARGCCGGSTDWSTRRRGGRCSTPTRSRATRSATTASRRSMPRPIAREGSRAGRAWAARPPTAASVSTVRTSASLAGRTRGSRPARGECARSRVDVVCETTSRSTGHLL